MNEKNIIKYFMPLKFHCKLIPATVVRTLVKFQSSQQILETSDVYRFVVFKDRISIF